MTRVREAGDVRAMLDGYVGAVGLSGGLIVHVIDRSTFVVIVSRGGDLVYEAALRGPQQISTVPGYLPEEGRA